MIKDIDIGNTLFLSFSAKTPFSAKFKTEKDLVATLDVPELPKIDVTETAQNITLSYKNEPFADLVIPWSPAVGNTINKRVDMKQLDTSIEFRRENKQFILDAILGNKDMNIQMRGKADVEMKFKESKATLYGLKWNDSMIIKGKALHSSSINNNLFHRYGGI